MTERLRQHRRIISLFLSEELNPRQRNSLVKVANKQEINIVGEVVLNFLEGRLPIKDIGSLLKYRQAYHSIAKRDIDFGKRKRLVLKHGKAVHILFTKLKSFFEDLFQQDEV